MSLPNSGISSIDPFVVSSVSVAGRTPQIAIAADSRSSKEGGESGKPAVIGAGAAEGGGGKEAEAAAMITRSNLAEQLREYQIRSKYDWASVSFFSSTASNFTSSRVDVVVFVIWELVVLAFLVFSAVSLYFRRMQLALILICVTMLLLLCMRIAKQVRLARKKKRRMLLPLSM